MFVRSIRRNRVLAGLAAVAFALSACGGDDAATSTPAPSPQPAPSEAAPATPEPEAEANPLEGQLITLVVGVNPGGGHDTYARFIAPYLAAQLNADVTVANEPGAGSLLAVNNTWTAKPDGLRVMQLNGFGVLSSVLAETEGIEFELDEFEFIGRIDRSLHLVSVHDKYEIQDASQVYGMSTPIVFGATGPGGGTANSGALLCAYMQLSNCRVATGYGGSAEIILGVTAGEVNAVATDAERIIPAIGAGHTPLFSLTADRHPKLPDVPTVFELGLSAEDEAVARAHSSLLASGRVLVSPPGTPDDVMAALRGAFDRMVADPAFLADAESRGLGIDSANAEEIKQIVEESLNAPQVLVDIYLGN